MSGDTLQLAVDALPDQAFVTFDREGRITFWNLGAQRLLGYDRADALGQHVASIFVGTGHTGGVGSTELEQAARGGVVGERWLTHRNGSAVHAKATIVPVRDGSRLVGYAALAERLPSASAALPERVQELQRAVAARDEFIATVAHELRNPISPLTFQIRLAINKVEQLAAAATPVSTDWIGSQLRRLEERFHRLLETLDRLLDVSRLSSGRIDLQLELVDLADVTGEVVHTMEAELAVARSAVTITQEGATTGYWDRLRLEQICRNLLSNAMRFGAGRPIEVALIGDRDQVTIRVRDHGVGIAADQQAVIFERFERGAAQPSGGFGVGLWIVRNICTALGGSIAVDSELGQGACFTVTLPRRLTVGAGEPITEQPRD